MSDLNIFVPKESEVRVFGKVRKVKPLTLKRAVELSRLLSRVHEQTKDELKDAVTDVQALVGILSLVDSFTCAKIIETLGGFCLEENERAEAENIEVAELARIVNAVGEVNDFAEIFENFTRAFRDLKKSKTLSGTPSEK